MTVVYCLIRFVEWTGMTNKSVLVEYCSVPIILHTIEFTMKDM